MHWLPGRVRVYCDRWHQHSGTGYIGSFTTLELLIASYDVVVVDNLYNSSEESINRMHLISGKRPAFYKIDVTNESALDDVFAKHPNIDSVVHFAALKVGLRPSLPLLPGAQLSHRLGPPADHVVLVLAVVLNLCFAGMCL
jgi:hypothetical protein